MRAQKKSIRDFFSPAQSTQQRSSENAPPRKKSPLSATRHAGLGLTPTAGSGASSAPPSQPADHSLREGVHDQSPGCTQTQVPTPAAAGRGPAASRAMSAEPHAPKPSQDSTASGASRRVVSNGEHVVLNSDSDSDSLPDLDWGEPRASLAKATPTTRSKRTPQDQDDVLRKPDKKGKNTKRSFNALVHTAQQNMEIERKITQHKANLDEIVREPIRDSAPIDEDTLGQVIEDDDDDDDSHDKAHRLFLAMQRTNATQVESTFYFFDDISDSICIQPKFPLHCLPNHRWASSFANPTAREQAFLTGFAYQVFRWQQLPDELALWMLDQACLGPSEVLSAKYLDILESHVEHVQTLLNKDRLNTLFKAIGGNVKCLASDSELLPTPEAQPEQGPSLPPSLKSIVRLLERTAPWLSKESKAHALYTLCHICLDDRVQADADILDIIRNAIEAIICNIVNTNTTTPVEESSSRPWQELQLSITLQFRALVPALLSRITHPALQRNLVCALPAASLSTAYFQRYLAFSFLLHPLQVDFSLADPRVPDLIHVHLERSPHFRIGKETDYGHLAARLTLLDIAVGPGFLSVPHQALTNQKRFSAGPPSLATPNFTLSKVGEFNKEIDALVQHLKILGNSIIEAGAVVDFSILDAKDRIERLCARLEYAVKIGGKKGHDIFGTGDEEKQSKVSKFFFQAREVATPTVKSHGIFGAEYGSKSDA